jgi:hypothetical protein
LGVDRGDKGRQNQLPSGHNLLPPVLAVFYTCKKLYSDEFLGIVGFLKSLLKKLEKIRTQRDNKEMVFQFFPIFLLKSDGVRDF